MYDLFAQMFVRSGSKVIDFLVTQKKNETLFHWMNLVENGTTTYDLKLIGVPDRRIT